MLARSGEKKGRRGRRGGTIERWVRSHDGNESEIEYEPETMNESEIEYEADTMNENEDEDENMSVRRRKTTRRSGGW
jgi:hypothetical protein